jgi:hypothetical protein
MGIGRITFGGSPTEKINYKLKDVSTELREMNQILKELCEILKKIMVGMECPYKNTNRKTREINDK